MEAAVKAVRSSGAIVLFGEFAKREDAREAARAWAIAQGISEWDAEELSGGRVDRAWHGGGDRGFVQEDHEGAQAVTVVFPASSGA